MELVQGEDLSAHIARGPIPSLSGGSASTLTGSPFQARWSHVDMKVDDLLYFVRTAMPPNAAQSLPLADHAAVVALLELGGDFLAFDARTGREVYRFNTGGPIGGGVVTYSAQGRQYIAVASGIPSSFWVDANPGAPTVVIFALARQNP